jgi:hypothetical protein
MLDTYMSTSALLLKAWQSGKSHIRASLIAVAILFALALGVGLLSETGILDKRIAGVVVVVLGAVSGVLALGVVAYQSLEEQRAREQKVVIVEERLREHPEKPQLAWDLARTKLENYLDRNLSQVRSIYWLTLLVMACGFGFVMYGLFQASQNPEKLPVSIVASASGVLISFIGGSFLLIYRSILAQSKEYVTVLERINAVGMAVQVISSIPEASSELKHKTTAELAKQLLGLYANPQTPKPDSNDAKG